ncbi:hypothetical protein FG386_002519 [Cryptosporidium ryanae]|uniref:uncharacterized protein n=1 Tax=Cryptosporidium ryanae TaxID=515981 RepID=UPI00351A3017|nr:hypothetical protein FG386_002519 [Cryptosporidium ryanae]
MNEDRSARPESAYRNLLRKPIKFKRKPERNFLKNGNDISKSDLNVEDKIHMKSLLQGHSLDLESARKPEGPANSEKINDPNGSSEYQNSKLKKYDLKFLTKTELSHKKAQRENIRLQIQKRAALTHRQRVSEFNEKLSLLPEHFDIPKVGPG